MLKIFFLTFFLFLAISCSWKSQNTTIDVSEVPQISTDSNTNLPGKVETNESGEQIIVADDSMYSDFEIRDIYESSAQTASSAGKVEINESGEQIIVADDSMYSDFEIRDIWE